MAETLGRNTFTFRIEGDVTLEQYADVLQRVQALLNALAADIAPGVPIRWVIAQRGPSLPSWAAGNSP